MDFITKISTLCLFTLLSAKASAVEWGRHTTIKHLYVTHSGSVFVTLETLPGCYNDEGAYLANSSSDDSKAYSAMLAAFMAQKKIQPLYEINENATGWSKCKITSFFIVR